MPRVIPVDRMSPDPSAIAEAAAVLARGGLVAFPTETVYGLGARGLRAAEVARIFEAKGRPSSHPLILHVEGEAMARGLSSAWPSLASAFARALWPGPLTLVVPRAAHVPAEVSGGLDTVGVRAPEHPVALALLRAVGEPLAAPSANAHTHVSPTTAAHVARSLGDRVDLILDAGPCAHGIESTVLDVSREPPRVLRPGAASLGALRAIAPDVVYEAVTIAGDAARASPGLAAKHYAPRARVVLADTSSLSAAVREATRREAARGGRACVLAWSAEARAATASGASLVVMPDDAEGYARALFAALYAVETTCEVVVIESVPDAPAWWAVRDRLRRAASS